VALSRGEEMGWFEHGSTIIVFAPQGAALSDAVREGERIHMGRALMRLDRGEARVAPLAAAANP